MLIDISQYQENTNTTPYFIETTEIQGAYITHCDNIYSILLKYKNNDRHLALKYSSKDSAIVALYTLVARINALNNSGQEPQKLETKNRFQEILDEQ